MTKQFFVTGTDTEVGKTMVSCALLSAAKQAGLETLALKPVAAGCEEIDGLWCNEDALALMEHMTVSLPYERVNPIALKTPASPHIAAHIDRTQIDLSRLVGKLRGSLLEKHDFALVEGAGGWRVPLSNRALISDLARELNFPVIMVINLKLGCLNHALLTAEAIRRDGLKLVAWAGNQAQSLAMEHQQENIATLESSLGAPCLGILPFSQDQSAHDLAAYIDLEKIR